MTATLEALRALDTAPHWLSRAPYRQAWFDAGIYTNEILPQVLARRVAADPDVRIVFGSHERPAETTIGAAFRDSGEVAAGLLKLGLVEGDVVVLQLPNWREGLLALIAAWRVGLIVVPMIHTYGPAELGYVLGATCAKALIVPDRWKKIDYAQRIAALEGVELEHVIVVGDGPMPRPVVRWQDLLGDTAPVLPALRARPDDACLINFTSGTTSAPKGVVHTHHTIGAEVPLFPGIASPTGRPKLMPLPGGHIAGLIGQLQPFLSGQAMVLMDQFDEALSLELLRAHRCDRAGGVPFQVAFFCDHAAEGFPDGCLQMSVGAANVPASLMRRCEELGWPGTRSYGSTEHPSICGSAPDDPLHKRVETDGRLLTGVQVRLVDETGDDAPCGSRGEIVSMGPELCKGYLDPELNRTSFSADGWFHTGDIAVLDEDCFLTIVDRKKDIIIRGGENISSKEVEDVLMQHPSVAEAAAVAWPCPRYGERVGVFTRLNSGAHLVLDDVRAHFRAAGVSIQKTPEYLVILEDFPRTPAGKILKTELREQVRRHTAKAGA